MFRSARGQTLWDSNATRYNDALDPPVAARAVYFTARALFLFSTFHFNTTEETLRLQIYFKIRATVDNMKQKKLIG